MCPLPDGRSTPSRPGPMEVNMSGPARTARAAIAAIALTALGFAPLLADDAEKPSQPAPASAPADTKPFRYEESLPGDGVLLLRIPSVEGLIASILGTPLGRIATHPGTRAALKGLEGILDRKSTR